MMSYKRFFATKHYTFTELITQVSNMKKYYPQTTRQCKRGKVELTLTLKPTPSSIDYTIKLFAKQDSKVVNIFVIEPKIELFENGKKVPHLYSNGALCLFYPKYYELSYSDLWAKTLIPWTSLWLFYYEIWKETGEWLGGGIHGKKNIPPEGL